MTDEPVPEFEFRPPFSVDFLVHLQVDVYDEQRAGMIWPKVLRDPDAVASLERINAVRLLLGQLRDPGPVAEGEL